MASFTGYSDGGTSFGVNTADRDLSLSDECRREMAAKGVPKTKEKLLAFLLNYPRMIALILRLSESFVGDFDSRVEKPDDKVQASAEARPPWFDDIAAQLIGANGQFVLSGLAQWAAGSTLPADDIANHIASLPYVLQQFGRIRDWEPRQDHRSRTYYVHTPSNIMTWLDPRDADLPRGWKISNARLEKTPVFADILTGQVTISDPRLYPHLMQIDQTTDAGSIDLFHRRQSNALPETYRSVLLGEMSFLNVCNGIMQGEHPRNETPAIIVAPEPSTPSHATDIDSMRRLTGISVDNAYTYTPVAPRTIRLLRLRIQEKILICSFNDVHLDDEQHQYLALSYEWGSGPKSNKVVVQGESGQCLGSIQVTETLHNALCSIATSSQLPNTLFADQISINQDDKDELGQQVAQMGDVYRNASLVVTYHPEADEYGDVGIELLVQIHKHFEPYFEKAWKNMNTPESFTEAGWLKAVEHIRHAPKFKVDNERAWQALSKVRWGPWTKRLWMVPENILNSNTKFLIGSHVLPWKVVLGVHIYDLMGMIERPQHDESNKTDSDLTQHTYTVFRIWFLRHCQGSEALFPQPQTWTTVMDFTSLSCFDGRDKVYALLSLMSQDERLHMGITPDYSESNTAQDVYREFARAIMYYTDDLRLLEWAESMNSPAKWPSWESWVPDLRQPRLPRSYMFSLDGGSRESSQVRFQGHKMHVSGFELGSLGLVTSKCPGSVDNVEEYKDLLQALQIVETHLADMNRDELHNKFACCMVCNTRWRPFPDRQDVEPKVALHALLKQWGYASDEDSLFSGDQEKAAAAALNSNANGSFLRSVFVTTDGHLGLCHVAARPGDRLVYLFGGSSLYILRHVRGQEYRYIGCAFISEEWFSGDLQHPYDSQAFALI